MYKRYRLLILGLMVFLIPLASAIYDGQNITQAQLDAFNIEDITKQFLECQSENNTAQSQELFYIDYSCFSMRVIEEGVLYQVYRDYYSAIVIKAEWETCRDYYSKPICESWFMENRVMPQVNLTIQGIKLFVKGWQTNNLWSEIREWLEGLQL